MCGSDVVGVPPNWVLCTLAVCDPSICGHAAGVSINGCASFRASVEGAYGEQVAAAELQGRVGHFPAGGCSRSLMTMSDLPEGPKIEIGHQQSRTRASSGQCLATAQTRRPSATAGVLVNGSPDSRRHAITWPGPRRRHRGLRAGAMRTTRDPPQTFRAGHDRFVGAGEQRRRHLGMRSTKPRLSCFACGRRPASGEAAFSTAAYFV